MGTYIDIVIGLTTTLIAVYIPLGIFVFTQNFGENNIYKLLDQKIITKKIFNIRRLIIYLFRIFLPLFLVKYLEENGPIFTVIPVFIVILFLGLLIYDMIIAYKWSYYKEQNKHRKNFLNQETDQDIRKSILGSSNATQEETELIAKSFFEVLKIVDDRTLKSNFLEIFLFYTQGKKNYQNLFAGYGEFSILKELLYLYFKSWSLEIVDTDNDKNYGREMSVIDRILQLFFIDLEQQQEYHVVRTISDHIKEFAGIQRYKIETEPRILRLILDSDKLIKSTTFLKSFIKKNKYYEIGINNFNKQEIIHIVEEFFEWLMNKIVYNNDKEYNVGVDNVCHYLLPGIDNITFVTLFTFATIGFDPENRVLSFANHKNNFGHIGNIHTGVGDNAKNHIEKEYQLEIKNAIILFDKLCFFSSGELEKYLKECNDILNSNSLSDTQKSRVKRLEYYLKKVMEIRKSEKHISHTVNT